jgi:hypothetical protein
VGALADDILLCLLTPSSASSADVRSLSFQFTLQFTVSLFQFTVTQLAPPFAGFSYHYISCSQDGSSSSDSSSAESLCAATIYFVLVN